MAITPVHDWGWQSKMAKWGDWHASPELRFTVPPHTTTDPPTLQQKWMRNGVGFNGHLVAVEDEWRDVPTVVVGNEQLTVQED